MSGKSTFSKRISDLETIVGELGSEAELENSVKLYEKGIKLAKKLREDLQKMETRVEILTEDGLSEVAPEDLGRKEDR